MTDPYSNPAPGPYDEAHVVPAEAVELEPTKPTPDAVYNSLNYFDELAIKRCFGAEPLALKQQPGAFMRSLVFSLLRKVEGLKDAAAQERAFNLPNSEVYDFFHIEKPPAKCVDKSCPCAEHVKDEDDDEDPTELLS